MKVFYELPLTPAEEADLEYLCSRKNKYAQAVVHPGVRPHTMFVVAGRGSSKTTLEGIIYAYETYLLLSLDNPQARYGLLKASKIHLQNAATDEKTSLELFEVYKAMMEQSEWFKKINYRPLEREIRFPRRIRAESLHSNSRSVRGRNTKLALFDEMAFLMESSGAIGGKQLWNAITQSVKTRFIARGHPGRIVGVSSGGPASGIFYELCSAATTTPGVILFQLATWEMVPGLTKDDFALDFKADEESAEMEIGAQFGALKSKFLVPDRVDACVKPELFKRMHGERGIRYFLHLDPGLKKAGYGLAIVHKEIKNGREAYIVDHLRSWHGTKNNPVRIGDVEAYVLALAGKFRIEKITFDQFNSASTIQYFQDQKLPVEETPFTDTYNYSIYSNLKTLIDNEQLELYDEEKDPDRYEVYDDSLTPEDAPTAVEQLKALERHNNARRYTVKAPTSGKCQLDDLADAVAAACYQAAVSGGVMVVRAPRAVGRSIMADVCW